MYMPAKEKYLNVLDPVVYTAYTGQDDWASRLNPRSIAAILEK